MTEPLALKYGAVLCLAASLALLALEVLRIRGGRPYRFLLRYCADLDRRLRLLFIDMRGSTIAAGQLGLMLLGVMLYALLGAPHMLLFVPLAIVLPRVVLARLARKRVQRIEAKLDGFVLALANALRATPSIGAALASVQPLAPAPLDEELELVLREMRVGSTLEQALLGLGARVDSQHLDAVLRALLIGRKVGGDVPEILDSTAAALREMARLSGVLRAKTAEARVQAGVLAAFPLGLLVAFDALSPGYFDPLMQSAAGLSVVLVAACCWVASVLLARRIMAVAL